MAKNKKNNFAMWALVIIALYGGSQGWFKGEGDITTISNQETINQLEQLPTAEEICTISISPSIITAGDLVTGTLNAEPRVFCETYAKYGGVWQKVWEGNTDINGRVSDSENIFLVGDYIFKSICGTCVTNEATLTVNPAEDLPRCVDSDGEDRYTGGHVDDTVLMISTPDECLDGDTVIEQICAGDDLFASILLDCPITHECILGACILKPGWNLGDIVSDVSDSGTMPASGGVGFEFHDLTDFEVVPGGPRRLGARIYTNWDYVNQDACFGFMVQEGMEWMFSDSDSVEWQVTDNVPQAHNVDLCPLSWDGNNLWFLDFFKTQNIPGCDITYDWSVEIYVCE